MKEFSIEQKAKAYDEALERMKSWARGEHPEYFTEAQKAAEFVFPELKESEDERIRNWLICYFKEVCDNVSEKEKKGILAWLEKQSEQKPAIIIPKFRVGDEIKTTNEAPLTITKITDSGYWSEDLFICSFENSAKWELVEQKTTWSEEDEKEVAVLEAYIRSNDWNERHIDRALGIVDELVNKVKSLRPQKQWKPTKEQIIALRWVLNYIPYNKHKEEISGLLDQIKEL